MMDIPGQAFDLARKFEGLRLAAYLCPAGIPTIGYGATGADIRLGMHVTQEWAEERLARDLARALRDALRYCPVLYLEPSGRVAAITDFVFNLGAGRLAASTLRKRINAQDWAGAACELEKWIWGGGKKLPGLILRRGAERALL